MQQGRNQIRPASNDSPMTSSGLSLPPGALGSTSAVSSAPPPPTYVRKLTPTLDVQAGSSFGLFV
ncbi:hypothetical protein Bca4012_065338 [Brassica carinata]